MQITTKNIKALNPYTNRLDNFASNYPNYTGDLTDFLNLDNITYEDKVWVFTRLATHIQNVHWSILCSESVLQNYESIYPNDNIPRKAIEAAKTFVLNPSEENKQLANVASFAAQTAARAADNAAASFAAYAADYATSAATAANYVDSAANSVLSAHYVIRSAADYATVSKRFSIFSLFSTAASTSAAAYAYSTALETQQELNLQFMVEAVS